MHEAMRLAMELESYNMAVRQSPSIRAVVVTEDSASNEKTPEYEQLKETLFVVTEGVQKLLPEKRAAPPKDNAISGKRAAAGLTGRRPVVRGISNALTRTFGGQYGGLYVESTIEGRPCRMLIDMGGSVSCDGSTKLNSNGELRNCRLLQEM